MCITWVPIKFFSGGGWFIIINKKYIFTMTTKKNYSVNPNQTWTQDKDFIEAGKARLDGDTIRETTSDEVKELRQEKTRNVKVKFNQQKIFW